MWVRKWALSLIPVVSLLGLAGCGQATVEPVPKNAVKVQVVASDWQWSLSKKTFKVGKPIDFQVSSVAGGHGFAIKGTKIHQPIEEDENPVDVVWTPTKPGQYTIYCDVYCGAGHDDMKTVITVKS